MTDHYFTENPTSEIREKEFSSTIKGTTLVLTSVSGVFAHDQRVDKASELLIKHFTPSGDRILDVGCGYGAIGLFIKALYPGQQLHMIDINNRAVEYAKLNAQKNKLTVHIQQSDLFSHITDITFDDIVSNPPIAAGKKFNTGFIHQSYEYLNPNGALWLVAFHNKGGETLKAIMKDRFGNVADIEKSGGMRVYKSVKQVP